MDYFFAQIEERENPHFKGKPVVVGADPKGGQGRGVVAAANYEARKFGIHSALPISLAFRLCPKAVFLPVDFELYREVSQKISKIAQKYSPQWEQVSLDEGYLDISSLGSYKRAKALGEKLRKEILEKEKLTSTVGIGPNKLMAKLATNKAKPNGLFVVTPAKVRDFLKDLDIQELPGIGPKTAARLRRRGIIRVGRLARLSKKKLTALFGKRGETMGQKARGIDKSLVAPEREIKSIGKEHTFARDTRDTKLVFAVFERIIQRVFRGVTSKKFAFKTITVVCRFTGFETHTKAKTLGNYCSDLGTLKKEGKKLLLKFLVENPKKVRLIGLRVSNLINEDGPR